MNVNYSKFGRWDVDHPRSTVQMQGLTILGTEYYLYYTDVAQGHGLLETAKLTSRLTTYCSVLIGACIVF